MKTPILIAIVLLMLSVSYAEAQTYTHALGVRGGSPSNGISYKRNLGGSNVAEVILSFRHRGFQVTGLYQRYTGAFDVANLNWFYGAGGHVGIFESKYSPWPWSEDERNQRVLVGIDGILGLEYEIQEIPFAISVDYKPYIVILDRVRSDFLAFGLGFRYTW